MMKKRWCGALLALALVLTLLQTALAAEDDITGAGTADDPYLIYTAAGLKQFRDKVNGQNGQEGQTDAHAKLMNDIVLNDGTFDADGKWGESGTPERWEPIEGFFGDGYSGTFDGGGHTIQGLYINSDGSNIGLFGSVKNATIKNLTVTGYVKGGSSADGTVGSLVGSAEESTIQNCVNLSNVTGTYQAGGLIGQCEKVAIANCANLGSVKVTDPTDTYAGGIVGYAVGSVEMTACYNVGEVNGTSCVGGLLGHGSLKMTSCYNVGNVMGTERIGGLVGEEAWRETDGNYTSLLTVNNCYYLDTAAKEALGKAEHFEGNTSAWRKSETEFETDDGVLSLLRGSSTESPWADTCKTVTVGSGDMKLPWFAHPGNEHNWSAWQHQNSTHTRKCQNSGCDATITEDCSGGTATCTTQAVCKTCGSAYGTYHHNLTHFDAVAATTTAEGNIEYWHCPDCGKYFKDDKATVAITQAETVTAKLPGSTPYYPPSYAVTVEKAEHGSVTVSPKSAAAGATVTLTVTPDEGYTPETLTVTDRNGNELPLTDKGGGKYTFPMPSGSVTVKATFMDDNTMLNFFVDVKASDYFCDAVLWAAKNGITSGTDAAHFSPNLPCTRGQIVTFLWRAAGSPVVNYAMDMTDVPEGSYYAEAVRWALSLGITTGTGADAFSPDAPCTRAQAVMFLARARNAKASGGMAVREFADFDRIPAYAVDAIQWALESGITNGTSDAAFSPDEVCIRAQIVTFLYRAFS